MSSPTIFPLGHEPIQDHCFSADGSILAITKDSNVEIYSVTGAAPRLLATLADHDKKVTAVDISLDGKIVTCSQDRNAIVWTPGVTYTPTLVLLRIDFAATAVRWSPSGDKIAVGSGDGVVAVCYFEEENDWWISKHIKVKDNKRSTVTNLEWHPNNVLLAVGYYDFHARVFSAYVKAIDARPGPSVWGDKFPFAAPCGDFQTETQSGWVHDVAFSPSGDVLAFVSQDNSVNVVYPGTAVISLQLQDSLPFTSVVFTNEGELVAAGHDCHPVVFRGDAHGWAKAYALDDDTQVVIERSEEEDDAYSHANALNMFKQLDLKGKVVNTSQNNNGLLPHIHQNTITRVRMLSDVHISTSGRDGKVVIFTLN
ncbi:hypothetical protein BABINDRAFT_10871 [Babjeviella inositovora NRRL Y-12698]|uniref:Actin-related protein 2/3 complex subunit n=1 Tax=Babjeviella inositovora NRRL Y-12698 TaxID=984486 RepID=A0A1E3QXN9_9ASCO|nr:uncharacterized protein BABINDRAFT_10871 [Babjeviella inositovora NRRL Y-12698]ODQ82439.1 hypothetical protein BABINDRAFT_10871 [Babjeviella inositovora NRRL Y-12698]